MKSFAGKKNKPLILALALVTVAFSCKKGVREIEAQKQPVTVLRIEPQKTAPEITSFGNVSFVHKADLTTSVEGVLKRIYVEEGSFVRTGQRLAVFENIQLVINRDQALMSVRVAESSLELAETQYREARLQVEASLLNLEKGKMSLEQKERELAKMEETRKNKRELLAVGGISEETMKSVEMEYLSLETEYRIMLKEIEIQQIGFRDGDITARGLPVPSDLPSKRKVLIDINTLTQKARVEQAEAELESTRGQLNSAEKLLEELVIYSPLTGVVGMRSIEPGERAPEKTSIMTLFDASQAYIIFNVQENSGIFLTEGLPVEISVDSHPDKIITGELKLISPTVDPQTGNITIKAIVDNRSGLLKPGMFARVRVAYGEERMTVLVPDTAIIQKKGNEGFVFVVVNNRLFRKKVTLGQEKEGKIEVLDGLKENDQLVLSPSPVLREGEEVEIIRKE